MSYDDEWDDRVGRFNRKPVRTAAQAFTQLWIIILLMIVLSGLTGGGIWFFKVVLSDTKGAGDAEIIKNEARNRIRAQEGFEDKFAAIVTADKNLTLTADALAREPSSQKLSVELIGQKMICNDAVGRYNADARKFSKEDFKSADLPDQVDDTDPATDCKENAK
jgi:hypothetical protein